MTAVIQGQQTYKMFPDFAAPGQLGVNAQGMQIRSYPANEVINPGRAVEISSDGLSIQQVQNTASSSAAPLHALGVSVWRSAREGSGSVGFTPYGTGGPAYQIGEMVPVLMRGTIYVEWKGTTQTAFMNGSAGGTLNAYGSSTTVTDRGKFTDAAASAVAGSEVKHAGSQFNLQQVLPGTGNIAYLEVNLPGAV